MTGGYNVFVGDSAGNKNATGIYNAFVGASAGSNNIGGGANTFIGYTAGQANLFGSENTFMGAGAGFYNRSGTQNTFVGYRAGYNNTTSSTNTFVGYHAGYSTTSGVNTVGNVFIGWRSGFSNTAGIANVFIGSEAGVRSTTGQGNLFLGQQAGGANTTGNYNLFVGNSSGSATTTGNGNTAIGDGSLLNNQTGTRTTAIGQYAGNGSNGNDNIFIGYGADVTYDAPNVTNAVAIGSRSVVSQSNSIVLGANANVGIGTSAPQAKLHIVGPGGQSGLRLENLTSKSTPTALNLSKFLSVDETGNVILANTNYYSSGGRLEAELWQRNEYGVLQTTEEDAVVIGLGISKRPSDYNLFVSKGILTEKVKVAVKNTNEWSDKVFETDYQLQPLADVGAYIQANKHLPGVPSASEVVEKGIDVAKMDAKLLEKIEELTLYSIQQQKVIDELKQRVSQVEELKQLVKQLMDKK
ncbi:TMF family protein [Spirosoma agri]|uniref:TMF family protein n=2 Tax=Spirosoma agri TaxID=1987381 RepID=A0A6M0IEQ1_9BACT|nr:TMF family protein [Spirosoma agri]